MPDDSNWKTPVASPRASISYVLRSSSGIEPMSRLPISSTALSITSRLRRPRKSTFSSPTATTLFIENCVTTSWSAPFCCSGTVFISGSAPITTPAAWIESWRVSPSSGFARSTISRVTGSESYAWRSSAPGFRHSSSVCPGPSGIAFATLSTTPYGTSSTRPASRTAARAAIVPKVMICATRSRPYFSAT